MSVDVKPAASSALPLQNTWEGGKAAYRCYVLVLLFLLAIVNTVDRSMVPALAEPLKDEFRLSDGQFGLLVGVISSVTNTACVIPLGLLLDRLNRAKLLASMAIILGGATMLLGAVQSFLGLVLTRIGVAGAEAGGAPTSVSLLTDYFPPGKRATASGILISASGIGSFLAFAVAGWIGATYGWRTAFVCAGVPALLLGLLALFTLREPPRGAFDPQTNETHALPPNKGLGEIIRTIIGSPTIRYLTLAAIFTVFGIAALSAFSASFFVRVHHLPLARAGLVTGLVMGGAFTLGASLGGFLSDVASRRSPGGGCYLVAGATFLAAPCAIGGFLAANIWISAVLLFSYKVLVSGFFGATFAGVTRAAPIAIRGGVTTFVMLLWTLFGAGFGPQVAGLLSDRFAVAGYADPLKWSLMTVSSAFLVSSIFFLLAARSMDTSARS